MSESNKFKLNTTVIFSILVTLLCLAAFALPFEGLSAQGKGVLIVFIWAIAMWILRPMPEFLTAILAAAVLIVVFKVPGSAAASGFSSTGWWLVVFATMLGGVMSVTGIGHRLAYTLLVKIGSSPLKVMFATTMANNIMAAFMPSAAARGAISVNIVDSVCAGMGFKPGEHKGDHGLMLANLFTNTSNTFLFFTATGANIIGMTIVQEMTGKTITWGGWLLATCVPAIVLLILIPLICYKLYPTARTNQTVDVSFAKDKLKEMGPMTRKEKSATVIMILTLIMWATESLHGISSASVAFFMAVALFFPGIGACSWKEIESHLRWAPLIWLGFAMSIASVINSTGGFKWLVETLFMNSDFFTELNFLTFMLIWLTAVVFLHIIFAGMNAMVAVLVPVGISMAVAKGFDPYIVGLMTTMAVSIGANFLPFNSAPNMLFMNTGRFTIGQEFKGATIFAFIAVAGFVFALTIWWPIVGLM